VASTRSHDSPEGSEKKVEKHHQKERMTKQHTKRIKKGKMHARVHTYRKLNDLENKNNMRGEKHDTRDIEEH
jgi:hypothetical protein